MAKAHWFHDMTPAQKKAYLAKHPTSKYAKGNKTGKTLKGKIPFDKFYANHMAQAAKHKENRIAHAKKHKALRSDILKGKKVTSQMLKEAQSEVRKAANARDRKTTTLAQSRYVHSRYDQAKKTLKLIERKLKVSKKK